jgi:hypothetical protein
MAGPPGGITYGKAIGLGGPTAECMVSGIGISEGLATVAATAVCGRYVTPPITIEPSARGI